MMLRPLIALATLMLPTQAFAFDFGFIRGPDWMDAYVFPLAGVTFVGLAITIMCKPRGVPVNEMYQHFGEFSALGRMIYAMTGVAFTVLMGMVFWGMGLARAAEASF